MISNLEDNLRRAKARHMVDEEDKKVERARQAEERHQREIEEKRAEEENLIRQIELLKNKTHAVYMGDLTKRSLFRILIAKPVEIIVGDFSCSENYSPRSGAFGDGGGGNRYIELAYRGIASERRPDWDFYGSKLIYFPEWNLTLPTKLIEDAKKVVNLEGELKKLRFEIANPDLKGRYF